MTWRQNLDMRSIYTRCCGEAIVKRHDESWRARKAADLLGPRYACLIAPVGVLGVYGFESNLAAYRSKELQEFWLA